MKGPTSVGESRPVVQIYAAYEGYMIVWDLRLSEKATDSDPSDPTPCLPTRIKSVFKVSFDRHANFTK